MGTLVFVCKVTILLLLLPVECLACSYLHLLFLWVIQVIEPLCALNALCAIRWDFLSAEVVDGHSHSTSSLSGNVFVEVALAYVLSYIATRRAQPISAASINILADTDYYSQPGPTAHGTGGQNSRFVDFHVPLHKAHKTGLGSSAALVTAFTAALLTHYLPAHVFSVATDSGKGRLHNLAQAAHCAAQGKVGSGFDVAAAVYGSCVYRRFSPSILEEIGDIASPGFSTRLKAVVEDSGSTLKWDTQVITSAVAIPKYMRLVMCDVDCGSQTVGMVKKVLAWRKEKPEEARLLWAALQKGNEELAIELRRLCEIPCTPDINYQGLRDIMSTIRSLIREMSAKSGVPIEPKVQTELLDACCQVPGVIGGIVPGAGGYDAIALLVVDEQESLDGLQNLLDGYTVNSEGKDSEAGLGKVRLLRVRQATEGVRTEDSKSYAAWLR